MNPRGAAAGSRVGWGFDAHRINDQPPLVLGGVTVSDSFGVEATSDGDVLAHAVTDAVLGACVLGDIGQHFPSDDAASKDANSMFFVRQAATMAMETGWKVVHVDATVVAESIRVAPHRDRMRGRLADALEVDESVISIKATTTDGLGYIGRSEGIAAVAVVTVEALS